MPSFFAAPLSVICITVCIRMRLTGSGKCLTSSIVSIFLEIHVLHTITDLSPSHHLHAQCMGM